MMLINIDGASTKMVLYNLKNYTVYYKWNLCLLVSYYVSVGSLMRLYEDVAVQEK